MMTWQVSVCGSQKPPQQSWFAVQASPSAMHIGLQTSAPVVGSGAQIPLQHWSANAHDWPSAMHGVSPHTLLVQVPEQQGCPLPLQPSKPSGRHMPVTVQR